ncbi:MAG: redoxin domain-containing protein [Pseudomonadales bacterium]|nr:redoxin domain-containing protein [Pseudomonadales bacterium]
MLDGFEARLNQFTELGVKIYAASSDPQDKAQEVGASLSFPIGWGVERDLGDTIGVFWDERRNHIQPSEFLINRKGRILSSTYSSSPVGRMDPQETLTLMGYLVPK